MEKQLYLTRRDILTMINDLHEDIVNLFDCEACSLYFPSENEVQEISYLEEEEKLLLPLRFAPDEPILGIFLIRKPSLHRLEILLPSIQNVIKLSLDKLILKKTLLYDTNTELFTKESLITSLSTKIERMREAFSDISDFSNNSLFASGSAGVLYFHFSKLPEIAKKYGHLYAEECLDILSQKIFDSLPHDAVLARVNNYDCALLLTEENCDSRKELNDFIYGLCHNINSILFSSSQVNPNIPKNVKISADAHAGYILFPQDYDNLDAPRDAKELAHAILSASSYAAFRAYEQKKTFLPYSYLLQEGGNISKLLPHNQLIINLGKNVAMTENTRFSVYGIKNLSEDITNQQKIYKGEINILEIYDEFSLAELSLLYDPAYPISEKDTLIKLPDDYLQNSKNQENIQKDNLTQLYKYSDFLTLFTKKRQEIKEFTLALLQVDSSDSLSSMNLLAEIVELFTRTVIPKYKLENIEQDCIFARYSENNILFFLPQTSEFTNKNTLEAYKDFASQINEHLNQKLSIGIAEHPLLHFKATDALENSKKALECAKLLDFPHVSFCDSIALTISADKLATQGLIYDALQEYQNAILADQKNALALNSLGVTLVSLKRYSEAQTTFAKALEITPDDISILYNLGGIAQTLGDMQEARDYYDSCLQSDEYYYFALLRLAQIAEIENNLPLAEELYHKAIVKDKQQATPYRQLAKIKIKDDISAAREYLYTALRYTQYDAISLVLLAKIYLEYDKDANIAAALLKPIMTQRQTNLDAWKIYSSALSALGRNEEAQFAENKIQNLSNLES